MGKPKKGKLPRAANGDEDHHGAKQRSKQSKKSGGKGSGKRGPFHSYAMDDLEQDLAAVGLRVKNVSADGNCFFRALSDQLHGNEASHGQLRAKVMAHVEANSEQYEPFVEDDEPFAKYLARMRKDGTWAGHIELQAASTALGVNICVYQAGQPVWTIKNFPESSPTLHLSYHDGQHYNSVRLASDFSPGPPKPIGLTPSLADLTVLSAQQQQRESPHWGEAEVERVMAGTGCGSRSRAGQALESSGGDVDQAIELLIEQLARDDASAEDSSEAAEQHERQQQQSSLAVGSCAAEVDQQRQQQQQAGDADLRDGIGTPAIHKPALLGSTVVKGVALSISFQGAQAAGRAVQASLAADSIDGSEAGGWLVLEESEVALLRLTLLPATTTAGSHQEEQEGVRAELLLTSRSRHPECCPAAAEVCSLRSAGVTPGELGSPCDTLASGVAAVGAPRDTDLDPEVGEGSDTGQGQQQQQRAGHHHDPPQQQQPQHGKRGKKGVKLKARGSRGEAKAPSRNKACPCGSKQKYKNCCGGRRAGAAAKQQQGGAVCAAGGEGGDPQAAVVQLQTLYI